MPRPVPVSVLPVFIRLLVGRIFTKPAQVGVANRLVEACFQNPFHSPQNGAEEEIWHPVDPGTQVRKYRWLQGFPTPSIRPHRSRGRLGCKTLPSESPVQNFSQSGPGFFDAAIAHQPFEHSGS